MEEEEQQKCISMKPFEDSTVRRGFILKVFSLVTWQLTLVTAAVLISTFVGNLRAFLADADNHDVVFGAFVASIFIYLVCVILVSCVPGMSRRYPANIILLFVITGSSAVTLSIVSATFQVDAVMYAVGMTALGCAAVFLYFVHPQCASFFSVLLILLTVILIKEPYSTIRIKLSAGFVAVLMIFALVYDINRIMGRSSGNALSPEEYIVGALEIYSDILIIFLIILVAISLSSGDGALPCDGGTGSAEVCPSTCFSLTVMEGEDTRSQSGEDQRSTSKVFLGGNAVELGIHRP